MARDIKELNSDKWFLKLLKIEGSWAALKRLNVRRYIINDTVGIVIGIGVYIIIQLNQQAYIKGNTLKEGGRERRERFPCEYSYSEWNDGLQKIADSSRLRRNRGR